MHGLVIACAMMTSACMTRVTPTAYVAPSAHHMLPEVTEAVARLNEALGEPVFEVRVASREAFVDGAFVVRLGELPCDAQHCYVGQCVRTESGVVITLTERAFAIHIAHELLHAVDLGHSQAGDNLMARAPYAWNLTPEQIARALAYDGY